MSMFSRVIVPALMAALMIVAGALRNMDPSLEEAGQVAGLSRFRTMRVITLPVVGPSILSGAVLAFVI